MKSIDQLEAIFRKAVKSRFGKELPPGLMTMLRPGVEALAEECVEPVKASKSHASIIAFPFPDNPEAVGAWEDWRCHLRQKKVRTTNKATEMQIAKCVEMGPTRTIAAILHSIASNYQGLFEPRNAYSNSAQNPPRFNELSKHKIA